MECEWKVQFEKEIWTEIVQGVTESDIRGAKDVTKISADDDACDDDDDEDDNDDDLDGDRDNLVRPVNVKEDNMYHVVFQKLFGILKKAFIAATKNILVPFVDERGEMTMVSLESRIQSEWDMNSIVGVNIWGRENIPGRYADAGSVGKESKVKQKQMSQESNCGDGDEDDDSDYRPSSAGSDTEESDYVASQRDDVENVALELETPLWINANGFIENKMRSK